MLACVHHERRFGAGRDEVSVPSLEVAKAAIKAQGVEVFRVEGQSIQLAERVRSHLMDAGVSVHFGEEPNVQFTVRAQTSDFPTVVGDEMFEKVRTQLAGQAQERGFVESERRCRPIHDPVDAARVLDIWYELTFSKAFHDLNELLSDVRWACSVSKCVGY
jgi:hypothetical protein